MHLNDTLFHDSLQLYWYLYDCLYDVWLETIIGSRDDKILNAALTYIQSMIELLQRSDDKRQVKKWVHQDRVGYNLIYHNIDDGGFQLEQAENANADNGTFVEIFARWFKIKISGGKILYL